MNDNFPNIVEEDGGFAIYINDEKVDWYDNEADAEGVALCMIDENPFTEEDFERPVDDESLFESVLKDAYYGPGMYTGRTKYYTGLPYKDCYCEIVECPGIQASDGIGEGTGRESAIFRHYYEDVIGRGSNENGELVVEYDGDVEQLIRGIWRVAQIERSDKGVTNKNMFYDYIGADWKDICKVNAALSAIVSGKKENKPWSQEKADDVKAKQAKAEEEAKQKAEEAEKQRYEDNLVNALKVYTPDSKDIQRASDAWHRNFNKGARAFYSALITQLDRMTDMAKAKRRTVAFYKEFLKHPEIHDYEYYVKRFEDKIDSLTK